MNAVSNAEYKPIPNSGGCGYIKGIINNKYRTESIFEQSHFQIVKITMSYYQLLIAMIHNGSKRNYEPEDQRGMLASFHYDIRKQEDKYNCKNTIAIGDFNVNPFEEACVSAYCLHAIPYREEVANKPERIVNGTPRRTFYNPTWKFLGNRTIPYTSYYYPSSKAVSYYWNAFDQVLIRPELMNAFDEGVFRIISATTNHLLLARRQRKPDGTKYSDHLPLFCSIKEELI